MKQNCKLVYIGCQFLSLLLGSIFFPFQIYSEEINESSKVTGTLEVFSSPEKAFIIIDKDTLGETPYFNDSIKIGNYKLVLKKPKYCKYKERIQISKGTVYQLNKDLIPKKKTQSIRRLSFSTLSIILSGVSAIMFKKVKDAKNIEEKTWQEYMEPGHTQFEYDELYEKYNAKVLDSRKKMIRQNIFISATGISFVGFVISIPF